MKLGTWNTQGGNKWSDVRGAFVFNDLDVFCLQECGTPPISLKTVPKLPGLAVGDWRELHVTHYTFGSGNNRCSLGIVSKDVPTNYSIISYSSSLRPLVCIELESSIWVCCIHAPSNSSAAAVASALLGTITAKKWICAGDFNCDPSKMWKFSTTSSGKATQQSGGELDYAVSWNCTVKCLGVATVISDHYPVLFEVF